MNSTYDDHISSSGHNYCADSIRDDICLYFYRRKDSLFGPNQLCSDDDLLEQIGYLIVQVGYLVSIFESFLTASLIISSIFSVMVLPRFAQYALK